MMSLVLPAPPDWRHLLTGLKESETLPPPAVICFVNIQPDRCSSCDSEVYTELTDCNTARLLETPQRGLGRAWNSVPQDSLWQIHASVFYREILESVEKLLDTLRGTTFSFYMWVNKDLCQASDEFPDRTLLLQDPYAELTTLRLFVTYGCDFCSSLWLCTIAMNGIQMSLYFMILKLRFTLNFMVKVKISIVAPY